MESATSGMEHAMPEFDPANGAQLQDEPDAAFSGSIAPRWPNAVAVLAALAALEEEFKTVLNSRVPASD
jgi:hypothetical protein